MVRLTDRPDMTLDVYRGRKTTINNNRKEKRNTATVLKWNIFGLQCNNVSNICRKSGQQCRLLVVVD